MIGNEERILLMILVFKNSMENSALNSAERAINYLLLLSTSEFDIHLIEFAKAINFPPHIPQQPNYPA